MDSRIFIAVFAAFLTCLVPVVFGAHSLSTSVLAENGQLEFSVLLYKTIADSKKGNFAVSTIDVFLDLLRLYYGTLPPTRPILATILGVSRTVSPEHAYRVLLRKAELATSKKSDFRQVMLFHNRFKIKPYNETTNGIFGTFGLRVPIRMTDWSLKITQHINTEPFIRSIRSPGELQKIESIVFFEGGPWKEDMPLNHASGIPCTYRGGFYVNASLSVADVKYTHLLVQVMHGELPDIGARYIKLDWGESASDISTYIMLPNEQTDLNMVEKKITSDTIRTMIDNTHSGFIQLSLPEVNFESKLFLKDILQEMKISNVFSGKTNFSELADPPPEQIDEILNAVTFRAFSANGTAPECIAGQEPMLILRAPIPNFKMNRGAIIVLAYKGEPSFQINPFLLGMARYQHPTP